MFVDSVQKEEKLDMKTLLLILVELVRKLTPVGGGGGGGGTTTPTDVSHLWQSATDPTIYNLLLRVADQEYTQPLPDNTRKFEIQCRTAVNVRLSFKTGDVGITGANWWDLKPGRTYWEDGLNLVGKTLYAGCSTAMTILEIKVWT